MKKVIIITLILAVVGTASYFGYKAYKKSQETPKA
jgi:hypothetical protein